MPQYLSEKFLAASRLALGLPPAKPAVPEAVEEEEADDYRAAVRRHFAEVKPPRWSAPGPSALHRPPAPRSSQTYR